MGNKKIGNGQSADTTNALGIDFTKIMFMVLGCITVIAITAMVVVIMGPRIKDVVTTIKGGNDFEISQKLTHEPVRATETVPGPVKRK